MDLSHFVSDKYLRKDFEFLGSISNTPYGRIEKTRNVKDNKEYSLKIFEKLHLQDPQILARAIKEKEILSNFKNPTSFLPISCAFSDSDNVYFVLDYCPHGTLLEFMHRFARFPFELARFYAGELVFMLDSLRKESLVHSEITPANLVITADYHLHLTNFNNAHYIAEEADSDSLHVESPEYLAPESLDGNTVVAGDIWSVGCIIYQMLTGRDPFQASSVYLVYDKIRNGQIDFPGIVPPFAVDLIQSMLVSDANSRIGANNIEDLKRHIFFQALEIENIYSFPVPDYKHEMSRDSAKKSRVIIEGIVKKKAGWIYKRRILIITEEPKITYLEPTRKEFRGEIAISPQLRGEVKNKIDFNIITPKRTYYFKVINDTPERWVRAVAELVHKVYG